MTYIGYEDGRSSIDLSGAPDPSDEAGTVLESDAKKKVDRQYGLRGWADFGWSTLEFLRFLLVCATIVGILNVGWSRRFLQGNVGSIVTRMPIELWIDPRSCHYGTVLLVSDRRLVLVLVKDDGSGDAKVLMEIPIESVDGAFTRRSPVYVGMCKIRFTDGSRIKLRPFRTSAGELVKVLNSR
ncbi:hypothetical protein [Streptomyces sp. SID3343]|uniref:hypothetical protein n=1 Tax=Streptomyces sp. SID3343 TaxID=2690260 RepID=UPI001367F9CE|nr:hypothetical protein [Streptomyces sp. SID3343]MYW00195.1 hypothetical protein [Streptomyces sp. SID3343]